MNSDDTVTAALFARIGYTELPKPYPATAHALNRLFGKVWRIYRVESDL